MNNKNRGWIVVLAGLGINLCLGVLYTWSVFAKEITTKLKWSVTDATLPYTVAIALFAIIMVPAGRMQDKLGGRVVASIAGIMVGAGMIFTSFLLTPTGAIIGFGILTGIGLALGYGSATPTALKWFPGHKKGLIVGIVVAGFGGASAYASPLANYLLQTYGIQQSFFILGITYMIAIVLLAQLFKNPPEEWTAELSKMTTGSGAPPAKVYQYEAGKMMKTPQFYVLWLMFACTAVAGLIVIGHAAKIMALKGASWGYVLVAMLAVANASGRPSSGIFFDKLGRGKTCLLFFGLSAVTMLSLNYITSPYTMAFALVIVAFTYGSIASIFPAATAEFFGTKNLGLNYGLVFTGWGIGGVFGPTFAGIMFDATGNYSMAFIIGGVLSGVAALLGYIVKPPQEQVEYQQTAGKTLST